MQQKTVRVAILATIAIAIIGAILFFAHNKHKTNNADVGYITKSFPLAPTLGNKNAANSIILFEDLACPWCKKLHNGNYKILVNDYVKTSKAKTKIVIVELHDFTHQAIITSYCLAQQNKDYFQKYTDYIYNKVDVGDFETNPPPFFQHPTQVLTNGQLTLKGLDMKKLNQCIAKPNMQKMGTSYFGIFRNLVNIYQWNNGQVATPVLIVNGVLVNPLDYEKIKQQMK